MGFASSSRTEADLVAHFEYISALEGSERPAYVPVVASGANSLVIHYTENNCKLEDGEVSRAIRQPALITSVDPPIDSLSHQQMVLIDAGQLGPL